MSLIFDALQRAEEERSGIGAVSEARLAELLTNIERRTVAAWEASDAAESDGDEGKQAPANDLVANHGEEAETGASDTERIANELATARISSFPTVKPSLSDEMHLVCVTDGDSLAAEKIRFLGVHLRHLKRERLLQKILITSTIPHEGKTTVAANLACSLGRKGQQRTLLIDGDIRRGALSEGFGLRKLPGLCEWLQGESGELGNIYQPDGLGICLLPAGMPSGNPLDILQSPRLALLMHEICKYFEWVVIDSPPVLPLGDTSIWSRLSDGILLVARQGTTKKRHLQKGIEEIDKSKLIGSVLNCSHGSIHRDYYNHYLQSQTQPMNLPRE